MAASNNLRRNNMISVNKGGQFNAFAGNLHYHFLATAMPEQDLVRFLDNINATINGAVERMPTHQEFLDRYAKAGDEIWNKPAITR